MKKVFTLFTFMTLALSQAFAQPANNTCSTAQTVTPNGTCVNGTTVGATDTWQNVVACQTGNNNSNHPDVWYTFVATGTQAQFTVTAGTFGGNIELILVQGSNCAQQFQLVGSQCGPSPLNATFNGLQAGTTYFYTISNTPTGTTGTFQTCVTTSTPPPAPGQDCSTAAILCNSNTFTQGTSSAGFGVQEITTANSCWGFGGERQSKWFKFTVGCSGTLEFNIRPNNLANDYDWALYNITNNPNSCASMGSSIACNWSGCTGSTGLSSCPANEPGAATCGGPGDLCLSGNSYRAWGNWGASNNCIATSGGINVIAGNTYALLVDNFSTSNNGFTLTFGGACSTGTAVIGPNAAFTFTSPSCGTFNFTKTCQISPATNSSYLWAFGDGNTSTSQNPTHTYTSAGTYVISLTVTDALGCSRTSSQTVTVDVPVATATPSSQTICSGTSTSINLSSTITGTTFSWTATQSGVSGATAGSGNQINQTLTGNGTATYTITPTANGCNGAPITVTITVTPAPVATFSYTGSPYCQNAANPSPTFSGGGVAGTFTSTPGGLSINSGTGVVNLAGSTPGTYTVTNTINAANGCPQVTATSTITITALPVASFNYTGSPFCQSATTVSPTFTGGGVAGAFTSTPGGLSLNGTTGVVNIGTSTPGTYTVTNTIIAANGCPQVTANATITITPAPVATFSYTGSPYCQNAANPSPTFSGGGVAGTFTSTLGGLSINSATGVVNLAGSTPGTYTVTNTIAASGNCPQVTATATITITALPVASFNYTGSPFCQSTTTVSPTFTGGGVAGAFTSTPGGLSLNGTTGVVNIGTSTPGTYTVTNTIIAANGCPQVTANATITITPQNNAAFNYSSNTFCQTGTNPVANITGTTGGVFSASPAGLVFVNTSTGEINLSGSAQGTYTITYTTSGACPDAQSTTVTITTIPGSAFNYVGSPYCQTALNPLPTFSPGNSAGAFSSTNGLVFVNSNTGEIDLSASTPGTYTVTNTIASSGTCPASVSTNTITIDAAPTVNAGSNQAVCEGTIINLIGGFTGSSGVQWTSNGSGSFGNSSSATTTYTPSLNDITNGSVTLTLSNTGVNGTCPAAVSQILITLNSNPVISTSGIVITQPTCGSNDGSITGITATGSPVLSYSWNGAPGVLNPDINNLSAGNYSLTVTDGNGCSASVGPFTLNSGNTPASPTASGASYCQGDVINAITANGSGGTITWYSDAALTNIVSVGNTYTPSVSVTTTFYITETVNGCESLPTPVTITIIPKPAIPNVSSNSPVCEGATLNLSASGSTGTYNWSGPNSFNSNLQNPVLNNVTTSNAGVYQVFATSNGCSSDTATITVQVNLVPASPLASSNAPICGGNELQLFASTVTGATYSWSGPDNFNSSAQNPVIVSASGSQSGTYSVIAIANGCSSIVSSVNVIINAVIASFDATPNNGIAPLTVALTNNSSNATNYQWDLGNGQTSTETTISTVYEQEGEYTIVLIASNGSCTDTFSVQIIVEGASFIAVPNVFSPNGDGKNDLFKVEYKNISKFKCEIFNRWGENIFTWEDVSKGWEGKKSSGGMVPEGTYYYIINADGADGKNYEFKGTVSLFK